MRLVQISAALTRSFLQPAYALACHAAENNITHEGEAKPAGGDTFDGYSFFKRVEVEDDVYFLRKNGWK